MSRLSKHVARCIHCGWALIRKEHDSTTALEFMSDAEQHCLDTEHTVMVQE